MSEPDFDALIAVGRELERLADAGELTKDEYVRLYNIARKTVGGRTEYLEGILMRGLEHGFITR
jgi:hypothetical protein